MTGMYHILATADPGTGAAATAQAAGAQLDIVPFIATTLTDDEHIWAQVNMLAVQSRHVIFTSANAVLAVSRVLNGRTVSGWDIWCLKGKTEELVREVFAGCRIQALGMESRVLGNAICTLDIKNVVFFCGNIRMNTLPDILNKAGVTITEVVVYETTHTPVKLARDYDAVLFYSPSAVDSFFSANAPATDCCMAAIGNTTAGALRRYRPGGNIVVSETQTKDAVLETAIACVNKRI